MLVGACVGWIGFRCSFSALVRGLGGWVDDRAVVDCLCACGLLEFSGFVVSQRSMDRCRPVPAWTGSDFGVYSPIRSTGTGGCVVGGLMVGAGLAGRSLEFCGFAVWQVVMDVC